MSGTEGHFRVNHNVVLSLGHIGVKRTVNHTLIPNYNRLEIVPFPFFIPIAALDGGRCNIDFARVGELIYYLGQGIGIVGPQRHIGCHTFVVGHKTLVPDIAQHSGQQIRGILARKRLQIKPHFFIIVHIFTILPQIYHFPIISTIKMIKKTQSALYW